MGNTQRIAVASAMFTTLLLCSCTPAPTRHGVYRSGPNAIIAGSSKVDVKVWGGDGMATRTPTPGPKSTTLVGAAGPLWRTERDIAAPLKPPTVPAALVERAGIRVKAVLGTSGTPSVDAARPGGVYVRSIIKTRQTTAPPIVVLTATGDDIGAGRYGGPADVRTGNNCKAAVASVDAAADAVLSSHLLDDATRICAVPYALGPIDLDGDGGQDFLIYGQEKNAGFRAWFTLLPDGTLLAGEHEVWENIPE